MDPKCSTNMHSTPALGCLKKSESLSSDDLEESRARMTRVMKRGSEKKKPKMLAAGNGGASLGPFTL